MANPLARNDKAHAKPNIKNGRISPAGYAKSIPPPPPLAGWPLKVKPSVQSRGGAMLSRGSVNQMRDFIASKQSLGKPLSKAQLARYGKEHPETNIHDAAVDLQKARERFQALQRTASQTNMQARTHTQRAAQQLRQAATQKATQAGLVFPDDFRFGNSFAGRFVGDLTTAAFGAVPGTLYAAQNLAKGPGPFYRNVLQPIGASMKQTAEHPLLHPGNTAMMLYPAVGVTANTAARLSAVASGAGGVGLRGAIDSAVLANVRGSRAPRMINYGENSAPGLYSRSALTRGMQKLHDKITKVDQPYDLQPVIDSVARMSLGDLRDEARHREVPGYKRKSKKELVPIIVQHRVNEDPARFAQTTKMGLRYAEKRHALEARENSRFETNLKRAIDPQKGEFDSNGKFVKTVDTFNRASQLAQVYLKLNYLPVNMAGQLMLALAHGGPRALKAPVEARKIWVNLSDEERHVVHELMGGGAAASTRGKGQAYQPVDYLHSAATSVYSTVLDDPFRITAFMHEAHLHGYNTPEEISQLIDEAGPDLLRVTRRANRAMVDYMRLGKHERNVMRRLVYFYPWLKGSTFYGGHFIAEHPQLTGVVGQLGQYGHDETVRRLGDPEIPSFLQGIFVDGVRNIPGLGRVPTFSNPNSAGILSSPAAVSQALLGAKSGNVGESLQDFPAPIVNAAAAALGYDLSTGNKIPGSTSPLDSAPYKRVAEQWINSVPFYRATSVIPNIVKRGDKSQLLVPYSEKGDALKYGLAGTLFRRPLNPYERRSRYRAEVMGGISGRKERDTLSSDFNREDMLREVNKLRVKNGQAVFKELPPGMENAMKQRLELKLLYDQEQEDVKHRLTPRDKLAALTRHAFELGHSSFTKEQMEAAVAKLRAEPGSTLQDEQYTKIIERLEKAFFPLRGLPPQIAHVVNRSGGRVTVGR